MTEKLFETALGIGAQWHVAGSDFNAQARTLAIRVDFAAGSHFAEPGVAGEHPARHRDQALPSSELLPARMLLGSAGAAGATAGWRGPPRANRKEIRSYDRHVYKSRNLIERFFARLKQFRRISTRYDKLDARFESFHHERMSTSCHCFCSKLLSQYLTTSATISRK